ncbi:hypothetical protein PG987_001909 [Apiospora arundinis]
MDGTHPDSKGQESFDVVIIGAGIAGINCAYRLMKHQPGARFVILEGRDTIGGVWDQFRYPGVRSDSDIYTEIRDYLHDAVYDNHINDHIRLRHKIYKADWSSKCQDWKVTAVDHQGQTKRFLARWLVLGTGYIDYQSTLEPSIPGLDKFQGRIIHPQFWPADFQYKNQRMALIGSGATAVSMLPAIAKHVGQVTMIQRSPTYIGARPSRNGEYRLVPHQLLVVWRWLYWFMRTYLFVLLSQRFPDMVRKAITDKAAKALPADIPVYPHFTPRYDPWRQRVCLDSNGKFFQALHRPNVHLITGEIAAVTDHGIRMRDGQTVDCDVIVTATGHRMRLGGKIDIQVDGRILKWGERFVWNGAMLDGVPNMVFMLGYATHSWTLGTDNAAMYLVRLLGYMKRKGARSAVPRVPESAVRRGGTQRVCQLESTYIREAGPWLPVCGSTGPWKPKTQPPIDWFSARWGNISTDLDFTVGETEINKKKARGLSVDEILGNTLTINFAGYDTTSLPLSFTLMLLAVHPNGRPDAPGDPRSHAGPPPPTRRSRGITTSSRAVVLEALRLYTPITGMPKVVAAAHGGCNCRAPQPRRAGAHGVLALPLGLMVYTMILGVQTDLRYSGDDAREWRPSRWIAEGKEDG